MVVGCPFRHALVKFLAALIFLFLGLCFGQAQIAKADPIFQWTDETGRVHYGTKSPEGQPPTSDAKERDLPQITHENIDDRIRTIKAQTPKSCTSHGGVDCSRGADGDGSVICLDGFRDAVLPFRFECLEVRLQTELLVILPNGGGFLKHSRQLSKKLNGRLPEGLQLSVRNASGVQAFGIQTTLTIPGRGAISGTGPDAIDAYGNADYMLNFESMGPRPSVEQLEGTTYKVVCANCASVIRGQR